MIEELDLFGLCPYKLDFLTNVTNYYELSAENATVMMLKSERTLSLCPFSDTYCIH